MFSQDHIKGKGLVTRMQMLYSVKFSVLQVLADKSGADLGFFVEEERILWGEVLNIRFCQNFSKTV